MTELPSRRFLALWLPYLPANRWQAHATPGLFENARKSAFLGGAGPLPHPASHSGYAVGGRVGERAGAAAHSQKVSEPFAIIEKQRGALRLVALSPGAAALGLEPGMDLATARALIPQLAALEHDAHTDRVWLERAADACERFTPLVALDPPDGLVLDITGCTHLFADEAALAGEVAARLAGLDVRTAFADTPAAAQALARYPTGDIATLPLAALRLDDATEIALRRAGLTMIGDLAARPTAPLAARFGAATVHALDQLLGRADARLTPRRVPPALWVERRFAEPIATVETALIVLGELLAEAAEELDRRGRGGRRFAARFFRSDGARFDLAVETGLPTRDPPTVIRLFRERIEALADPIDPGFGFDMIRLAVPALEPLTPAQLALEGGTVSEVALAALVDRLSARLGRGRVRRLAPGDSHLPEQGAFAFPASEPRKVGPWPAPTPDEPPLRPLHLFDPPQSIEVIHALPDGPPRRFRWKRTSHDVMRHEGPERIAPLWWRLSPGSTWQTRDYYRVEDARGRRFWLFRRGLPHECAAPEWFVHGLFA